MVNLFRYEAQIENKDDRYDGHLDVTDHVSVSCWHVEEHYQG